MTTAFVEQPSIISMYGLTPGKSFEEEFSLVSFENILFNIIAFAFFIHEQISDKNATISRPQNLPNFKEVILDFRDGLGLVWINGGWNYDLTGVIDAEDRKIIDRCSVLESDDGELVIKIATDNNGNLQQVDFAAIPRITKYIQQKKVPGIPFRLINEPGDLIKTTLNVYVDPLLIDMATGKLLNTAEDIYPVKDAIKAYLSELEFNGAFIKDFFKTRIKDSQGIFMVSIVEMKWQFAAFPFVDFGDWKVPEAGYIKINDADLTINYLSNVLVTN